MTTLSDKARELIELADIDLNSNSRRPINDFVNYTISHAADIAKGYLELEKQNKELVWFADKMNEYVMPGEIDSKDSALMAFNKLREHNKKLREALESIAAIQIGPDEVVKSFFQGHDIEQLIEVATNDTLIARQALAEVKE